MSNILPREKQIEVLHHLVEGNTLRSTSRLSGVHRTTIMKLMVSFGQKCKAFMDSQLRGLTLEHVECDEVYTFVEKKQARLTTEEKAECHDIGEVYLWTALDAETKLVVSFLVGKRSADNARKLMRDVASRLVFPTPHDTDDHAFRAGRSFVLVHRELEFLLLGVSELGRASCRESRGILPRRFIALVPIPEQVEGERGRGAPGPGSGLGPWVGARVAPQQSPILRPGRFWL